MTTWLCACWPYFSDRSFPIKHSEETVLQLEHFKRFGVLQMVWSPVVEKESLKLQFNQLGPMRDFYKKRFRHSIYCKMPHSANIHLPSQKLVIVLHKTSSVIFKSTLGYTFFKKVWNLEISFSFLAWLFNLVIS